VRAVDQPRLVPGPGGDQRGQRHPRVVAAGHRDDGSMAAAASGAALRRPQALAGLVFPAEPGTQVRRRAFITGQVSSRHLATFSSSRSAARRAGTCALHPIRCSSTSIPASVYSAPNRRQAWSATRATGPALIRIPGRRRARVQDRLQLRDLGRSELALRAACPPGRQRGPAARSQRPPPPVHRHPRHPEPPRDLPVASPRLNHLGCRQPYLLPAGPLRRVQPAAIGIPYACGIPRLNSYPMGSPRSRLESPVRVLPHRGEQEVTRAPQPGQEIAAEQRSDGC
jgi:hypothetical protein